jgi:hypothetical protein
MNLSGRDDHIITLLAYFSHLDECEKLGIIDKEMFMSFFEKLTEEQRMLITFFQYKLVALNKEWTKSINSLEPDVTRSVAIRRTFDDVLRNFEKRIKKTEE